MRSRSMSTPPFGTRCRRDIRDRFVLTIDPVDARDFDDAISIEPAGDGGWRLGVHIADVSHYVAWGSSIDLEARRRSTSVYLADRVLPMLPERLSCDLCSLVPDEDRLAFSVDIVLDGRGRVRSYECFPSVIRSRVRLDYAAADALLASDSRDGPTRPHRDDAAASRARAALEAAAACGVDLEGVSARAAELARGAPGASSRTGLDRLSRRSRSMRCSMIRVFPFDIVNRSRTAATWLVEEAMLLANECVAERLADEGVARGVSRARAAVRGRPRRRGARAASRSGAFATAAMRCALESGDPHAIAPALDAVHATPYEALAERLAAARDAAGALQAAQRGALRPRAHRRTAISPARFRRYPDLLIHRALKMSLARERLGKTGLSERRRAARGRGRRSARRDRSAALPPRKRARAHRRRGGPCDPEDQGGAVLRRRASGERSSGVVSWIDQHGRVRPSR